MPTLTRFGLRLNFEDDVNVDAESINRHLDDTMWLGRAHSVGHARQHVNLIGFAISVAVHEHRRRDTAIAA
jgi:hypothetical protein